MEASSIRKKKLIFLSDKNRYLEHRLYCHLAKALTNDFDLIYFESDFDEDIVPCYDLEQDRKEKQQSFDQYLEISSFKPCCSRASTTLGKIKSILGNVKELRRWKKHFLTVVSEVNPAGIIMISPNSFGARLLINCNLKSPLVYIQPSTLHRNKENIITLKQLAKKIIYNNILKLPVESLGLNFFSTYNKLIFLLWSYGWVDFESGKIPRNIYAVGNPLLDSFTKNIISDRNFPIRKVLVILNKELNIGYDNWDIYANFYLELADQYPQLQFTFKAHPLGNFERSLTVFKGFVVTKDLIPYGEFDLMLTHWSSVCFEAIVYGLPTILVNPNGRFDFTKYRLENYPAIINSIDDFSNLKNFFERGDESFSDFRSEFIKNHMTYSDGKSTERVVEMLKRFTR